MRIQTRSAMDLGSAIARLRRERNMTQADLASWVGIDRTTVVRLESGTLQSVERLIDVLSALGADLVLVDRNR